MASVQLLTNHDQGYSSSLVVPTISSSIVVRNRHQQHHQHKQHKQHCSIVELPEICIIRILSYVPLTSLLTTIRGVCQHWRHKLVPHAVLMALRRQDSGCTIYMNPPYLNFSWVYSMSQADRIRLSPIAIDPGQDIIIFKPVRLPDQSGPAAEGWVHTEADAVDAALRAVRHFKVEFSGWPSGASARRYTRRQIKGRERRQELALRLATLIEYESSRHNSFYNATSTSQSNTNNNNGTTTATTITTGATTVHHLLEQPNNLLNNTRPSSHLSRYEVNHSIHTTHITNAESTLTTHSPQGNDEEDDDDDGIVEVTDPANQGYANVAAAAVMDADDQEPGTNGPVHYHHLAPVQPPIINITSNETNNIDHDVNETTLDVPSTTVASSNTSVQINVEDEEDDEEEEDEDELNSETDDATSVDASIHQQHPPVQVELGWNESNAADEWVRAWHRLHATYRPTFETFYTAEPIPGYRAITGFNSWYRKSISSTDWDLEQLNHSKNNSNDNDDDDDHGRSRIDSLITGGYTGDSGISVRYEHHPMYGFRIVWLRVSFAWLLSGWFVSAPDTRGPGATAMSTAYQQQQQQHNEYNGRGRVSFTSPLVSQRVQALDPYSHISITPSMGQTLVSSNGTWLGPVRPIFLLDGPDGVAAPETASLIGRSRHYGKGRRLLRRMHRTGRDFCRKLSCIPLNNRNGRNETRRSSPISTRRPHFFPVSATPTTTTGPATSRASHLFLPDPMPEPYRPPPHQASLPIYASRLYELQTAIETYGKFSSNELATLIRDSMSSMALSSSSSSGPLHDALLLSNTLNDTSNPLHWLTDPYNPMTIAWCAGELDCTALEFLQWQCTQMASGDYMATRSAACRRRMVETGLSMIGCDPTALWKYKHAKRYIIQGGGDQSVVTVARVAASERAYAKHWKEVAAARNRAREQQRLSR